MGEFGRGRVLNVGKFQRGRSRTLTCLNVGEFERDRL